MKKDKTGQGKTTEIWLLSQHTCYSVLTNNIPKPLHFYSMFFNEHSLSVFLTSEDTIDCKG